jgi:hypothetical protein
VLAAVALFMAPANVNGAPVVDVENDDASALPLPPAAKNANGFTPSAFCGSGSSEKVERISGKIRVYHSALNQSFSALSPRLCLLHLLLQSTAVLEVAVQMKTSESPMQACCQFSLDQLNNE